MFLENPAEVNLQQRFPEPADAHSEYNSSRITTGDNGMPLDPEQRIGYMPHQENNLPRLLHQDSNPTLAEMIPGLENGGSASQVTSRSLTFAVDGPQFEGNLDSFNQRIELTGMSYDYVNIIPAHNSSGSAESKDS